MLRITRNVHSFNSAMTFLLRLSVWISFNHVIAICFDKCLDRSHPDGTLFVGVSLQQCKEHCAVRNWCKVLGYNRLVTLCTLYRDEDILSKLASKPTKGRSCVYFTREELHLQVGLTHDYCLFCCIV